MRQLEVLKEATGRQDGVIGHIESKLADRTADSDLSPSLSVGWAFTSNLGNAELAHVIDKLYRQYDSVGTKRRAPPFNRYR